MNHRQCCERLLFIGSLRLLLEHGSFHTHLNFSTGKPIKTHAMSPPLTALQLLSTTTSSSRTVPRSEPPPPESVEFEYMSRAVHPEEACKCQGTLHSTTKTEAKLQSCRARGMPGPTPPGAHAPEPFPACSYDTVSHKPSQPMSRNSCCSRPWQT